MPDLGHISSISEEFYLCIHIYTFFCINLLKYPRFELYYCGSGLS